MHGDAIIYEGHSVSPRQLANAIADGSRNAWRDLWIRRPGDKGWKLADACRRELAKMAGHPAPCATETKTIAGFAMPQTLRKALSIIEMAGAERKAAYARRTDIVLDN